MANDFNDIDHLFRNRFEDYKDHSVNPSSQWSAFEAMLDAEQPVRVSKGDSIIRFISTAKKPLAIAAGIALLISAGIYSSQKTETSITSASTSEIDSQNISRISGSNTQQSNGTVKNGVSTVAGVAVAHEVYTENISSSGLSDFHNESAADERSFVNSDVSRITSSNPVIENNLAAITTFENSAILGVASSEIRKGSVFMPKLDLKNENTNGLFDTDRLTEQADYSIATSLAGQTFVKIGVRFGNGESNNDQVTRFWAGNALASIGYKKPIRNSLGIMAELTYLRRSGNGLERNQNVEVDRLYTAFDNSVNPVSPDATPNFTVDRSIIATRLDYLQVPVAAYFEPSSKTEINAGVYADLLFHARNETYLVYNQKDYVSRQPNTEELKSLEGLNRLRFGLSAGARYEIMQNISLDLKALLPLNSPFNKSAGICASQQANQSFDLYLGLRYTL